MNWMEKMDASKGQEKIMPFCVSATNTSDVVSELAVSSGDGGDGGR